MVDTIEDEKNALRELLQKTNAEVEKLRAENAELKAFKEARTTCRVCSCALLVDAELPRCWECVGKPDPEEVEMAKKETTGE